jgi:hypothetical protein
MGNRCARPINVVRTSQAKVLRALHHKGSGVVEELPLLLAQTRHPPAHRSSLTQPAARQRHVVRPSCSSTAESASSEEPMGVRVGGWEKAHAPLSGGGYGWHHHPTRKRADCPAVSRHEKNGGSGTEGVAHGGGFVPLVLPAPSGNRPTCSIVQPAGWSTADGSVTRPLRGLSRMKGNVHGRF